MLDPSQTLAYVAALGIAAAIPGPGITALVARAASSGTRAGSLVPLTVLVLLLVGGTFILAALAVRRWLSGARAQRRLHRGAALAMAGAAGTMVLREV